MKITTPVMLAIACITLLAENAYASTEPVPEINAGTAAIAIGLTVGIVALIKERRRKK
ncbi:MAG: hypothetical protein ABFS22_09935 [Pseudomonadota bacterium]